MLEVVKELAKVTQELNSSFSSVQLLNHYAYFHHWNYQLLTMKKKQTKTSIFEVDIHSFCSCSYSNPKMYVKSLSLMSILFIFF